MKASNIYTEGYRLIKEFLNNNLSDPRNRFKKNWIHASSPDVTSKTFDGYPFVTIKLDISNRKNSLQIKTSEDFLRIQVVIYSDEPTELDNLSNELFEKLNDKTLTYNLNEFKSKSIAGSDMAVTIVNSKKIFSRVFNITAKLRLENV
jgi:ABC-type Fe3+ transport system substrate-binding protein